MKFADAKLLDGPSTRWKWPLQRKNSGVYCGWLNSKNKLGAYTGWHPFTATFTASGSVEGFWVATSPEATDAIMVDAFCKSAGYDLDDPPS